MIHSMKHILFSVLILSSTYTISQENDTAINSFKNHPKIKSIIENNNNTINKLSFHSMPLDSSCGVVGCYWSTLVRMMNNPTGVNPQSGISHTALVSGRFPGATTKVELVKLKFEKLNQ